MNFDTTVYFVFLLVTVLIYWHLKHQTQNYFLLVLSYFFYGWWDYRFLILMGASTCINYFVAHYLAKGSADDQRRKKIFLFSLILNLSFLGFFKYFNFFISSMSDLLAVFGMHPPRVLLQILLPPGISFYTFQEVAYLVDVYKGDLKPAKRLTDYALFVSVFPHLIAGPIQRPSHLLPQLQHERKWNAEKVFDGLMLIAEGLFRKIVIADNCALLANAAFDGKLGAPNFAVVLLGLLAFSFQIYGDFSGYSNIARGSAQLLGLHFMVNFKQPYLSVSLQDFWRRWHISLSTWLRDYLYISLGGNRGGELKTYRNLFLTMLLGGLWHGANWTFVVWGWIHGAGLAFERWAFGNRALLKEPFKLPRQVFIFFVVGIAWIFFRAASVTEAFHFLQGLTVWQWQPVYWTSVKYLLLFSLPALLMDIHIESTGLEYVSQNRNTVIRKLVFCWFILGVFFLGANSTNAFIYFQF